LTTFALGFVDVFTRKPLGVLRKTNVSGLVISLTKKNYVFGFAFVNSASRVLAVNGLKSVR